MGFRINLPAGMKVRDFFNRLCACDIIYASPTINREWNMRLLKLGVTAYHFLCLVRKLAFGRRPYKRACGNYPNRRLHLPPSDVGGTKDPEHPKSSLKTRARFPWSNPRITVNGRYNWYTLGGPGCGDHSRLRSEEREKPGPSFNF